MKYLISILLCIIAWTVSGWGFYGHKKINRQAVFSLPPEMIGFYKKNIQFITDKAINPDQRRYVNPEEAPRHYIDLDVYGDSVKFHLPIYWNQAVEKYGEDSLNAHGIAPWHVNQVKFWLTKAFTNQDADQILRLSADLGHYIADAHVPLHTTRNYNGQLTNQYGIHGFWESRLPELFAENYSLFVGKAEYLDNPQKAIWNAVYASHSALDSVFKYEREISQRLGESRKFVIEQRGQVNTRTYSIDFSEAYHDMLNGMVERRMKSAIKLIADFWYTAWVDGGQPSLDDLSLEDRSEETILSGQKALLRNHESVEIIDN